MADKGLNSGDNIAFSTALGDGYIFSKSVRGASSDFKSWVLDEVRTKTETLQKVACSNITQNIWLFQHFLAKPNTPQTLIIYRVEGCFLFFF